jgi:hypothetical protein
LVGSREQIKCATLEVAVATAVRRSDPRCGRFIGVFLERRNPKSGDEPKGLLEDSVWKSRAGLLQQCFVHYRWATQARV